jgi:hypothetical protein
VHLHLVAPDEQPVVRDADDVERVGAEQGPIEEARDAGQEVGTKFAAAALPGQSPA